MQPLRVAQDPGAEVNRQAVALPDQARGLGRINTADENQRAADLLRHCKTVQQEVDRVFDPIVKSAHQAHKTAVEQKNGVLRPILEAERVIKAEMGGFAQRERDRLRRIEEDARRAARERQDQEALEEAARLEKEGRRPEAAAVLADAETAPPVIVQVAAPTPPSGVSTREIWKFRVIDARKLKPEFLIPDEKAIGQLVRAMKGQASSLVGDGAIEVYAETTVAAKGY